MSENSFEKRNINIDILRIIAAFMVLSVHVWQCVGSDFKIGAKGVQLFFIISGYLAFKTLDKGYAVKEYYKGRAIRIIPVYYLCLLMTYMVDLIIGAYRLTLKDILLGQCGPRFLRYFFFLQGIVPSDNWNMWNNHGALWSMSSFVIFYLAAPLLFKIMKRYYSAILILVFAIIMRPYLIAQISSLFVNYPADAHIEWLSEMNPLVEIYAFLLGSVLYVAKKYKRESMYIFSIFIVLILTSFSVYQYELFFVIILAMAINMPPIMDSEKVCCFIKKVSNGSFCLYLMHPMVLNIESAIWNKLGINSMLLHAIFIYLLCIAFSYTIYVTLVARIDEYVRRKCT